MAAKASAAADMVNVDAIFIAVSLLFLFGIQPDRITQQTGTRRANAIKARQPLSNPFRAMRQNFFKENGGAETPPSSVIYEID
jgi:hypothetical protein